jgi:hypothetical protein
MSTETEQLAGLIDAKHACLRQLCQLGQRQLESIAAADFSQLIKILAAKQRLLVGMQNTERQLDPFRNQSPESRSWPSTEQRQRCATVAKQCEALLTEIVAQEQASERLLKQQRDEAAKRLQQSHTASQARGAYHDSADCAASQLDLYSEN